MKTKIELINDILAEWNPLEVPEAIAKNEYIGYVPLIMENMINETQLLFCLENILINKLGLEYTRNNNQQKNDLINLCKRLISIK